MTPPRRTIENRQSPMMMHDPRDFPHIEGRPRDVGRCGEAAYQERMACVRLSVDGFEGGDEGRVGECAGLGVGGNLDDPCRRLTPD